MERLLLVAVSVLWLGGWAGLGVVVLTSGGDGEGNGEASARTEAAPPPPPPGYVRGCSQSESTGPLAPTPGRDTVLGPVTFVDAAATYRSAFRGRAYVTPDYLPGLNAHPMEVLALVGAARVRLAVPRAQRSWMRLFYRPADDGGQSTVTFEACPGRVTRFGGALYVDFENAPRGGRCAELEVQIPGQARTHRGRVFGPRRGECPELPVRVSPRVGRPGTTFRFAFRNGAPLGTRGERRRSYELTVDGPAEAGCVRDHNGFANRGRRGQRKVVRLDPRGAKGGRWCRGRFRGRLLQIDGFACPAKGVCRKPASFPAREREVGRFSFTVR